MVHDQLRQGQTRDLNTERNTGARELSESCVSQNSRSLETEQPCVLAQGGGLGCYPREIFATYGQICILSHFMAKMTCKTTCSRGHASG